MLNKPLILTGLVSLLTFVMSMSTTSRTIDTSLTQPLTFSENGTPLNGTLIVDTEDEVVWLFFTDTQAASGETWQITVTSDSSTSAVDCTRVSGGTECEVSAPTEESLDVTATSPTGQDEEGVLVIDVGPVSQSADDLPGIEFEAFGLATCRANLD